MLKASYPDQTPTDRSMAVSLQQRQYLGTAGLIYVSLLESPESTEDQRREGWDAIEAIILAAKRAGFDDETIAKAIRLPNSLVASVA